ncbi:hypothetical protein EDD11_002050 [Mortierella claussenii]|nr:hypothetical protein EDD11_002050 [Mortierella claussenii]
MDSDWCLFCEKHVNDLDALYCSKECARMDKLTATANKSSSSASSSMPPGRATLLPLTTSTLTNHNGLPSLSLRRSVKQPLTVSYPCMFRASTLIPHSISGRGGIRKNNLDYKSTSAFSAAFAAVSALADRSHKPWAAPLNHNVDNMGFQPWDLQG